MPSLIRLNEFDEGKRDPRLYFRNCYFYGGVHRIDNYEEDFPYKSFIHYDNQEKATGLFWVNLRKWVERVAAGDVMIAYSDRDYQYCYNADTAKGNWDRKYLDIRHGYWIFHFENNDDKSMFDLMHADKVTSVMLKYHPGYFIEEKDAEKSNVS